MKHAIIMLLCGVLAFCALAGAAGCRENKEDNEMEWTWLLPAPEERTLDAGEEFAVALNAQIGDANYFELRVESGADLRGVIAYHNAEDPEEKNEEDFYIGREQTSFRQILDFYFENAYDKVLESVTLKNAGTERASVRVNAVGCAVKEWYGSAQVFLEKENIRLGVDMNAGGAINYLELLNARVEQVKMPDGSVEIGINYAAKDGAELMYDSVNLINEMDRGRLVQQSYYGTSSPPYEYAQYIGTAWPYNPVQGGDYTGTSSQIVDFEFSEDEIYVKTRPLDWAKEESATDSYMENWYSIEDGVVRVRNAFTDFSGWVHTYRDQELPAFYGTIALGTLVTYQGDAPFTGGDLSYHPGLGNWVGQGRAYWDNITENWAAWVNEDDFGVGLYTPDVTHILTGKVGTKQYTSALSKAEACTYTTLIGRMRIRTFETLRYEYYLSVGNVASIRRAFYRLHENGAANGQVAEWCASK